MDEQTVDSIRENMLTDAFAKHLGIELLEIKPGYAKTRLKIEEHHLNFAKIPHGGVVFTLADQAFAAACNARCYVSVAMNVSISFIAAAKPGAILTATAEEITCGRRTGSYQVVVEDDEGNGIASFQGLAYKLEKKGQNKTK